jgi:hypothetical protein
MKFSFENHKYIFGKVMIRKDNGENWTRQNLPSLNISNQKIYKMYRNYASIPSPATAKTWFSDLNNKDFCLKIKTKNFENQTEQKSIKYIGYHQKRIKSSSEAMSRSSRFDLVYSRFSYHLYSI